jgi:type IV fimbrial biogenesis protein FimT
MHWGQTRHAISPPRQRWRGFTLIELMVTVALVAIVLAIGVPSFQTTIRNNRLSSYANEFLSALNLARTEAIRRRQPVVLCKSADGSFCQTDGKNWEIGWIVFVDSDPSGAKNLRDSTEPILRVWPAFPAGYTLRPNSTNFYDSLGYGADGSVNNNKVGGTFALCYQDNRVGAKAIVIKPLRPRLGQDSNGNRIPETDGGADISSCYTS